MQYQELEIKLLEINKEDIMQKLEKLGAKFEQERTQKIYTYDCYDPILMYKLAIEDYKITGFRNSLRKIINMISYIKPTFNEKDRDIFRNVLGYENIDEYIENNIDDINLEKLTDERILSVIEDTKNRFFKWIRLRQDGEQIELTLKYIYNTDAEYEIDQVKEVEILVNDFDTANKLVEEMGYYKRKLVEKKRISYIYNDLQVEIDEWPFLEPYVEIEGKNVDSIYNLVEKLGYSKEQAKVMNTEDVYLSKGIDLTDYEVMTFDKQQLA